MKCSTALELLWIRSAAPSVKVKTCRNRVGSPFSVGNEFGDRREGPLAAAADGGPCPRSRRTWNVAVFLITPSRSGLHALREPDDVALGVREHRELDRAGLHRRHDRAPAGLLDLRERALEVLGLDVEGDEALAVA